MTDEIPELLWVSELDDSAIPMVGSKMARLGQLRKWGLTVPDGFGLTKTAYQRFLRESKLDDVIDKKIAKIKNVDDANGIDKVSQEIRVLVDTAKTSDSEAYSLSKQIARAIERDLDYPGQIKVSVVRESRSVQFAV